MVAHRRVFASVLLVVVALAIGTVGASATDDSGGASAAAADNVTLTVTVVDGAGNPVGNAELSATWDGGGPVNETTKSNGKAFVDVPAGADVTITVDHPFYVRNDPYVVNDATARSVEVEVARKGWATVVVEDSDGRVEDAIVQLYQDGERVVTGRTNADGVFTTGAIEQDEYRLIAFKEGYLRNMTFVTVTSETRTTTRIRQDSVLVTFGVTDDHFDPPRPLSGVNVSVGGVARVTTLGNGKVTVSVPVNDQYEVTFTKSGYGRVTKTFRVRESRTSVNASIRRIPAINVTSDNDRVVVGEPVRVTVTDEYGAPVPNATVSLDGTTVAETGGQGVASVTIEGAGNHTIRVAAEGLEATAVVEGVEPAPDETPTATPTATATTVADGAGLGPVAAVLALLVVAMLARRR